MKNIAWKTEQLKKAEDQNSEPALFVQKRKLIRITEIHFSVNFPVLKQGSQSYCRKSPQQEDLEDIPDSLFPPWFPKKLSDNLTFIPI